MSALETPTVTVIIATYNKKSTLRYAIESVLWQTFADFECWVVGDGCTDGSEEIVAGFNDLRLNWTNLAANSGYQSAPANEGLRRSRGKYIAYLNHDDIWLPNHLQDLVNALEETNSDFVYSIIERFSTGLERHVDVPDFPNATRPPEASVTLHRRSVIDKIGYWKMPEETWLNPRVEYFRTAQFMGFKFTLVPYLTVLKFGRGKGAYSEVGPQAEYMARFRSDPQFVQKELGILLAEAIHKLEGPVSLRQLRTQIMQSIRRIMIMSKIDPGRLTFWRRRGQRIKKWREFHGLE